MTVKNAWPRKIAVIAGTDFDDGYDTRFIGMNITEWLEVDRDEFDALNEWCNNRYREYDGLSYRIIEHVSANKLRFDIANIVAEAKAAKEKRRQEAIEREQRKIAEAEKRTEKDRAKKLRQLEKLKRELGEE